MVAADGESLGEGLRAGEDDTSETREGRRDNTYSLFACWQERAQIGLKGSRSGSLGTG